MVMVQYTDLAYNFEWFDFYTHRIKLVFYSIFLQLQNWPSKENGDEKLMVIDEIMLLRLQFSVYFLYTNGKKEVLMFIFIVVEIEPQAAMI